MHLLLMVALLSTHEGWANNNVPTHILPLNSDAEKFLKESTLKDNVIEGNLTQKEFHRKIYNAYKKITPIISLNGDDPLYFVYDCLFLKEEEFLKKYSHFSKEKLALARKVVSENMNK